jgi:hypothetical protein
MEGGDKSLSTLSLLVTCNYIAIITFSRINLFLRLCPMPTSGLRAPLFGTFAPRHIGRTMFALLDGDVGGGILRQRLLPARGKSPARRDRRDIMHNVTSTSHAHTTGTTHTTPPGTYHSGSSNNTTGRRTNIADKSGPLPFNCREGNIRRANRKRNVGAENMRAQESIRAPSGKDAVKGDLGRTSGSRRTDNIAGTPSSRPTTWGGKGRSPSKGGRKRGGQEKRGPVFPFSC